jgi:hypothetical protein
MSLGKLLAMGQSLDAVRETTARYCGPRQGLLPKFGPISPAAHCPPTRQRESSRSASASQSSGNLATTFKWQAGREKTNPWGVQLHEGVLRFLTGARAVTDKALRQLRRLADKFSATNLFAKRRSSVVVHLTKSVTTPIQPELSLDAVKVVRNDLSDADLEVVPAGTTGRATGRGCLAAFVAPQESANDPWGRFAARLFKREKAGIW